VNPGGVLLTVIGVLVAAQVFKGQALERLGIVS
jgi:hypothetical protein